LWLEEIMGLEVDARRQIGTQRGGPFVNILKEILNGHIKSREGFCERCACVA
jgi:hypothetical protein